jgi:hypothetical protein
VILMALLERLRAWSIVLLGVCLVVLCGAGSDADAAAKKKKGPVTDPMEAEANPQGPPPTSDPASPPTTGDPGAGQSSGTSATGSGPAANPHGGNIPTPVQTEKVGRFMANFKIGPALCAYASSNGVGGTCNIFHQGSLVLELGWSVLPSKNAYLLFPLQFQFRPSFGAIMVPVGFQYDLALPVKGLFVYPRAFFGYAALISSGPNPISGQTMTVTGHAGVFAPEFGIKYIFGGRWNAGADLFSLPILFNSTSTQVYYRILLYGGVNF